MKKIVHIYSHRGYRNNMGKTLCGKRGVIYNNNKAKKYDHFNKEPFDLYGTTTWKSASCLPCLEIELLTTEEDLKKIKSKILRLKIY